MPDLDKNIVAQLKSAISTLNQPAASAGAWDALGPLSTIAEHHMDFSIDLSATQTIGAPVIVARPKSRHPTLLAPLTPRQREVAQLIILGHPNKKIARLLEISNATVKDHVHAILTRLDLTSRNQLTAALQNKRSDEV